MEFILNLSCPDKAGLVRIVSNWLYDKNCNIIDSDQFGTPKVRTFLCVCTSKEEEIIQILKMI